MKSLKVFIQERVDGLAKRGFLPQTLGESVEQDVSGLGEGRLVHACQTETETCENREPCGTEAAEFYCEGCELWGSYGCATDEGFEDWR